VSVSSKALRDLPQPINLSITAETSNRSVIQSSLLQQQLESDKVVTRSSWGEPLNFVDKDNNNCAARLITMAARAQQHISEQRRSIAIEPITSSPVKEATDALMLLQETA
jgi:hypothetical protein